MKHKKISKRLASEAEMIKHLVGFLKMNGYRVRAEVPNLGQSVDLVATKGRWVTFIEAKLSDWRQALNQCQAHCHSADFICIAIASIRVSDELMNSARERGYGVIQCGSSSKGCKWILEPRLNEKTWPPQRQRLSTYLRSIELVS